MKITIESTHVHQKKWEKEGGRSGVIRTQDAIGENRNFRQRVRLDLGKEEPYPVGEYTIDFEDNIRVGDFGDFQLARRPMLIPVAKAAPGPAMTAQPHKATA